MNEKTPFIPAAFDDFGFTPAQFRVVCRVARRGDCYESIPHMAVGCRLEVKTVKTVIRTLTDCGVIEKKSRWGHTSIFTLAPLVQWRQPSPIGTPGAKRPDPQPKWNPTHPAQKAPHEGTPIEGTPLKGEGKSPGTLTDWQLEKDEERLHNQIKRLAESSKPDPALLAFKRARLKEVREEMKRRCPTNPTETPARKFANHPVGREGEAGTENNDHATEGKKMQPSPELAAQFRKQAAEAIKVPTTS